jgi:methyl-accepting chemotaxis protein
MPASRSRTSLATRITVLTILVVVILLAGLSVGISLIVRERNLASQSESATRDARFLASTLDLWARSTTAVARMGALNAVLQEELEKGSFPRSATILTAIVSSSRELQNALIADDTGRIVAAADPAGAGSVRSLPLWAAVAGSHARGYMDTHPVAFPGAPAHVLTVASTVFGKKGGFLGAFILTVDLSVLSSQFVEEQRFGSKGYFMVVDGKGTVLAHPVKDQVLSDASASPIVQEIITAKGKWGFFSHGPLLGRQYVAYSRLASSPWYVAAVAPASDILALSRTVILSLLVSAVVAVGAVVGLLLLSLNRLVLRRIGLLVRAVERASAGDLTASAEITGTDELALASTRFTELMVSVSGLIGQLRDGMGSLRTTGVTLSSNMEHTAGAIGQITGSLASTRIRIEAQSAAVTETSSAATQLTRSIDSLNSMIENQSAAVAQSSAAIEEMIANIRSVGESTVTARSHTGRLLEVSRAGRQRLSTVTGAIGDIARQSSDLLTATRLISSIAANTNLLAMNASIEAAHAGAAGRGFAVVADEIRKLAEQAEVQSKEIARNLKAIKVRIDAVTRDSGETEASFGAVFDSVEKVGAIVAEIENAMTESREGGTQILQALGNINEITVSVRDGSAEMKAGNDQILAVIEQLNGVNTAVTETIGAISERAAEIAQDTESVVGLTNANRTLIEEVNAKAATFRIKEAAGGTEGV